MKEPIPAGAVHALSGDLDVGALGQIVAEDENLTGLPHHPVGIAIEEELLRLVDVVDKDLEVPLYEGVAAVVADGEVSVICHNTASDHCRRCISGWDGEERHPDDRRRRHKDGDERHNGDEIGSGGFALHIAGPPGISLRSTSCNVTFVFIVAPPSTNIRFSPSPGEAIWTPTVRPGRASPCRPRKPVQQGSPRRPPTPRSRSPSPALPGRCRRVFSLSTTHRPRVR